MLSALDQLLGDFLVRHGRSAQLAEYTPYVLSIGSILAWFVRGLVGDCLRVLRYRRKRRNLTLIDGRAGAVPAMIRTRTSDESLGAWHSRRRRSSRSYP